MATLIQANTSVGTAEKKKTGSDAGPAQDAPTPCRWRGNRLQSPGPSTRAASSSTGSSAPESSAHGGAPSSIASTSSGGATKTAKLCIALGVALAVVGIASSPLLRRTAGRQKQLAQDSPGLETSPKSPAVRTLRETVVAALASRGSRTAVLDVLAGVPAEFGTAAVASGLPARRSRYTARMAAANMGTEEEEELVDTVLQLLAPTAATWPAALRARLTAALQVSPQLSEACIVAGISDSSMEAKRGLARPLPMQVVNEFTSAGARSSGWLHQKILNLAAATGLSSYGFRASLYQSMPAAVVADDSPAIAAGDCLALRGNSSVALRILGLDGSAGSAFVHHIVIEQPPRWALPRIRASPRHFCVMGETVEARADPYSVPLGSFEYLLAAPAVQAFVLRQTSIPLRGLQLHFRGPGWGEQYFCIYRIRAYTVPPPSCSGVRLAETVAL